MNNPVRKIEAYLAKDPQLKDSGQRAFVSYVKSIFLMKDKKVFKVNELQTDAFAKSLGLTIPPRIRFLQRLKARNATSQKIKETAPETNEGEVLEKPPSEDSGMSDDDHIQINQRTQEESKNVSAFHVSDDSDDDVMLKIKREDHDIELPTASELIELENKGKSKKKKSLTKAAMAKMILKKKIQPNKKIVFDDEGETVLQVTKDKRSEIAQEYENEEEGGINIEKAKLVLKEEDKFDKQLFKEKVKAKHKEEKRKAKEKKRKANEEEDKDDFGTDSEEEPDLSWLPDPDKIYGGKDANKESEDTNEESEEAHMKLYVK